MDAAPETSPRPAVPRLQSAAPLRSTSRATSSSSRAARERAGSPACVGHDLTGAYGLEMRTVSAAVNASILPVVQQTASLVEQAPRGRRTRRPAARAPRRRRGDERRRLPPPAVATIGSGQAGCCGALHQLRLTDAIVVECGGTSSNVSVVKRGRPVVRSLRVMGRPTCVRAVDSWVVGRGGGSMALLPPLGRSDRAPQRPASPICPMRASQTVEPWVPSSGSVLPRGGDPEQAYACVQGSGRLFALTATCAANALGLVATTAYSFAGREAALERSAPLRRAAEDDAGRRCEVVARRCRGRSSGRLRTPRANTTLAGRATRCPGGRGRGARTTRRRAAEAAADPARASGGALLDQRSGLACSGRGDSATGGAAALQSSSPARPLACVASGAAPATVSVETAFDASEGVLRAVATGAVEAGPARPIASRPTTTPPPGALGARLEPGGAASRRRDRLLPRLLREWLGPRGRHRRPRRRRARRGCAARRGGERGRLVEGSAERSRRPHATSASRCSYRESLLRLGLQILDLSDARRPEDSRSRSRANARRPHRHAVSVVT